MTSLGEIAFIRDNIKNAPVKSIKALHMFIFESEVDRKNRSRLRAFKGFDFDENSKEFETKLEYVVETLQVRELISITNLLCLDNNGDEDELSRKICYHLMNLSMLEKNEVNEDDEDDKDDEDAEQYDVLTASKKKNSNKERRVTTSKKKEDNTKDDQDEERNQRRLRRVNNLENSRPNDDEDDDYAKGNSCFPLSFRDVEDSIRPFSGNDEYPVEKWIQDFEDTSVLLRWSRLHKFIFAKKSLKGIAKLYIQSEYGTSTWSQLREALLSEFSTRLNSAHLHQMLSSRKIQKKETVQEYFLIMKELASRGNVEDNALIQYTIDGITDDMSNKIILYGANNLKEFKRKLQIFESLRENSMKMFKTKKEPEIKEEARYDIQKRRSQANSWFQLWFKRP
jgi:hypothetical protein